MRSFLYLALRRVFELVVLLGPLAGAQGDRDPGLGGVFARVRAGGLIEFMRLRGTAVLCTGALRLQERDELTELREERAARIAVC